MSLNLYKIRKRKSVLIVLETGNITINLTLKRVRVTIFVVGKAKRVSYSMCVLVALVIRHSMSMQPIILTSEACLV
jgi:hypothetical protein